VTECPARGGDLRADEAGTDDDHVLRATGQFRAKSVRILDCAQNVDTEQALGGRQPARCASGRDDDAVRRDVCSGGEDDAAAGGVESNG
jgi:hypothetical protein